MLDGKLTIIYLLMGKLWKNNTIHSHRLLYKLPDSSVFSHTGDVGSVSPYDQGISSPNLLLWTAFLAA